MEEYEHYDLMEGGEIEYEDYGVNMHNLEEMPSTSFQVRGRTYLKTSLFAEAVKAVIRGKMNVNKAASVYRVPRSSLQRKVAQSRNEHKRKENPVIVERMKARAKRERDENEDEERRLWSDEYQRRLDEAEANVITEEELGHMSSNELLGMAITHYDHDYLEMASECIIEEKVDPLIDHHIYLQVERSEQREEEEDEIPPPPQIGIESGEVGEYEEEDVVVDEMEEFDGNMSGMPRLDVYEY